MNHIMASHTVNNPAVSPSLPLMDSDASGATSKRKRRPAGTPDPEAEVVALSPRTLMESDRYVCEICNQGFQRDQNLQMHRRRHKVPWKLLRKSSSNSNNNNTTGNGNGGSNNNGGNGNGNGNGVVKKRVYVCPDRSCLHNDPAHALGDLVGIKKHFRRKHSADKQWKCERCSKGYAVQSDFKAHLKTCGTRGHSCDCGKVFSRVESFMQHQDSCVVIVAKHNSAALPPLMSKSSKSGPSPAPASAHGHHHFQTEELQLLPKDKPPQAKQKQQQHQRRRHREGGGMSYESSSSTSAYEYEWAAAHEQQPNLELSIGFSSWSSAATVAVAQPLELNGNTVAAASASPASSPKCHHDHDNVLQAAARHYYHASYDNGSLPAHFQYMSMFP